MYVLKFLIFDKLYEKKKISCVESCISMITLFVLQCMNAFGQMRNDAMDHYLRLKGTDEEG